MSHTPEHYCWTNMLSRCQRKTNKSYPDYGGRGISVCDRWRKSFLAFYKDMGPRPSPEHTIERLDYDQNYAPENCVWLPKSKQASNTRRNRFVEYNGRRVTFSDAVRLGTSGVKRTTARNRLAAGWNIKDAIDTPVKTRKKQA